jgi:Carboxypeptidase regulatory-like domain/TonB-dependent Receptor Plug Domain
VSDLFCYGRNYVREVRLFLILSLLCVTSAMAQSPNATINGIVLDPSGAAIAGAQVVAVNDATGVQNITKTNGEGIYIFPNLPPGHYRIQVSNSGFKTIIKPDIVIHVQDALAINFTLPIGAASEVVTIQGGAPLVNTESGSVGTVIDRQFVGNLPLNGRSFNTLLQLTPGVVIAPSPNNGEPGQFSISGQRTDANNFTIDGVSANFGVSGSLVQSGTGNAQAFSVLGGTSSLVSVDALQEFRIETSSFAPEFGRAPGGQVILTTRSGTNDLHGSAFNYFRNTAMDANDWFANSDGLSRAPEHHNDFGGILGGPIVRNRTFFFFSYEGARLDLPQTSSTEVPSEYARSVAPPALAPFLDAYPQPNDQTILPGVYTALFTGNYANRASLNATSVRIDHTLNDRFSIFGRYNYAPSDAETRGGTSISPSSVSSTALNTQTLTVGVSMLLNNQTSNVLRGNYSAQTFFQDYSIDAFAGAVPPDESALLSGLPASETYAYFFPFDTALAIAGRYGQNQTRQMNFVDDFSATLGQHQLKFGGDYRGIFLDADTPNHKLFETSPNVATFLAAGKVSLESETTVPSRILSHALSLYGQDTWKIRPRVTVTYGIRWELSPPPSALGNTRLASWENVNSPAEIALAPAGTAPWHTTYSNFAPRFGIAYGLDRGSTFVIRAGGGIFYDLSAGSSAQLAVEFPNLVAASYTGVSVPVQSVAGYLPAISLQPPFPIVNAVTPDLKLPRSYQWNVALEKSFGQKQTVSLTYVGQAGRDLFRTEALFQPNQNFESEFVLETNDAFSNYDALQLQFRKTLSSRVQALLNYTWSHSLDNISNDAVSGLSNTVISGANDYASSGFDVRQSFSGAVSYEIPGVSRRGTLSALTRDWSADSVIVARTGFPFNAAVYSSSPDPGGYVASRPDLVSGQPFYLYGAQCVAILGSPCAGGKGLNPAAFSVPSSVRQGTEGRNDIPGFGLAQVDLSIARKFPITERLNLQFRADAFNALNHPNFSNPQALIGFGSYYLQSQHMLNQGLGGLNPLFQEGGPRSLQLSLKLLF